MLRHAISRRVVRVAEGARLEIVYTPKAYPGFKSQTLRQTDPLRRGGRVVECGGLENRLPLHGVRGFESLLLRHLVRQTPRTGAFFMLAEDAGDSNRKVLAGQWPAKGRAQRGPRALPQGDAGIPPPPPSCTTDAPHRGVFHVAAPVNWSVGLDGTNPRCVRRSGPVPTQCRLVRRIDRNEPPFRPRERTSADWSVGLDGTSRHSVSRSGPVVPLGIAELKPWATSGPAVCTSWTECFKTASMHQSALQGFVCLRYGTHVLNTACSHGTRRRAQMNNFALQQSALRRQDRRTTLRRQRVLS